MKDGIARIGKVIDHAIEKFTETILETRKGYNQTVFLYSPSGDNSVPCKNDKVIILKVDGTGNFIGVNILTESQGANPGEKIFFGRDANGNITSKLSMLNNGDVKLENKGDVIQKVMGNKKVTVDGDISVISKGDQEYSADKNINILAINKSTLKGSDVEVIGDVVITGGSLECKGTAVPTGTGCLCAISFCRATGEPHTGQLARGT